MRKASNEGLRHFIDTLRTHFNKRFFGPDAEGQEIAWTASLAQSISGYEDDILRRAAERICATRTDDKFPLPAIIRKICDALISDDKLRRLPLESGESASPTSVSRERWADDLLRAHRAMTRDAASEGWILMLHNFARFNGRLPERSDIERFKREAARFDENYEKILSGEFGFHGRELLSLATGIIARRDELARRFAA